MQVTPMPTPSASIQDASSASPAPAARAALKTIAAELVTPTTMASRPAVTAESGATRERITRDANAGSPAPGWRGAPRGPAGGSAGQVVDRGAADGGGGVVGGHPGGDLRGIGGRPGRAALA